MKDLGTAKRPGIAMEPEALEDPGTAGWPGTAGKERKRPELLLPAGSLEVLKIAVVFGADAVYIGGGAYGLRAKARNFSMAEMAEGIAFAHRRGARVYVTANILARNEDLEGVEKYFRELDALPERPDALIISDPGVFEIAKEVCPGIERHVSTQANNTNYRTFRFWHGQGAKRAVAARELSLGEIREIRASMPEDMELEAFVHGSMCISYSGRCLLSNFLAGRDANRGNCAHPCRWSYSLMEESRPGEYFPVQENERGTYIFNSRDLCMAGHIPELLEAGVDSLKVEGRMKTALYVAVMARTYRRAIDDYLESPELYREHLPWYLEQVSGCTYRPYTTGFYFGRPGEEGQIYEDHAYRKGYVYLGIAGEEKDGLYETEQRNKFSLGEEIEVMKPDGEDVRGIVRRILDEEGREMACAPHARQKLWIDVGVPLSRYDILRRKEECRP